MKNILCYGDSNTWGLIPGTKDRYPWEVRWTGLLQEKLKDKNIRVTEEGLCGRTTTFEDAYRDNRNGLKALPLIIESHSPIDSAVLMLGTNDCKSYFNLSPFQIAKGAEKCLDLLLTRIKAENILLISPILLGDEVWKPEFDPEFNEKSIETSKGLYYAYKKIADKKGIRIIAASDYAKPSDVDCEHLTPEGHASLAQAVYEALSDMNISA